MNKMNKMMLMVFIELMIQNIESKKLSDRLKTAL